LLGLLRFFQVEAGAAFQIFPLIRVGYFTIQFTGEPTGQIQQGNLSDPALGTCSTGVLNQFRKKGWIEFEGHYLVVRDSEKLNQCCTHP